MGYGNILALILAIFCCHTPISAQESERDAVVFVRPKVLSITDVVVENPGKGWLLFAGAEDSGPHQALGEEVLALGSTGYTRFNWKDIQPREGAFDWSPIDQGIAAWRKLGKQFAFRIMAANTHGGEGEAGRYITPKWVFAAGAKFRTFEVNPAHPSDGVPGPKVIPIWTAPVFKKHVRRLVTALGKRYDGHPDIAFIGIGTYGNWGEQHNWPYGGVDLNAEQLKKHMGWYRKAFKKTPLIVPWGRKVLNPAYDWAVSRGIGMRRDGVLGASPHGEECARAFGKTPAVFEWHSSYQALRRDKRWSALGFWRSLLKGRPTWQGTYWGRDAQLMYEEEPSLMREAANRLGYHFILDEARHPANMVKGETGTLQMLWRNVGLSRTFLPMRVKVALLDSRDDVLETRVLKTVRPIDWLPFDRSRTTFHEKVTFGFENRRKGRRLALGLFSGRGLSHPDIRLGIAGRLASGWYPLGDL